MDNDKNFLKRTKKEASRASVHRAIDRIFDEVEEHKATRNITLTLNFLSGGVANSKLNTEQCNFLKTGLPALVEDYNTRL